MRSQQEWDKAASSFMIADQREAVQKVRATLAADFDKKAYVEKWNDLNERIKAALPLDPASEQAQRFIEERDAMLKPILAIIPQELKDATKVLKMKVKQGELAYPLDAEVYRFHQEATRVRRKMEQSSADIPRKS